MRISLAVFIRSALLVVSVPLAVMAADDVANVAPIIQVRDSVEVDMESEITIGDIADFKGFDEEKLGEIRAVHLADAPQAGEARSFTNVSLSQIFRRHLPQLQNGREEKITLVIPPVVTIKRKTFRLEAKEIEDDLSRQWAMSCKGCEFQINALSLPVISKNLSPKNKWQIRVRPELPRGSFSVPIEITGPEGRRQYWISGQVSTYRTVPVAKRSFESGERFDIADLAFEKKEVTFANDSSPTEAEIKNSIAARTIGSDQVIVRSMLRREQAVRMGDVVKVVAGNEAWQVSIDAVAQQGGYLGDTVRVKVPRTQKMLSGVLREKGLVEVR